MIVKEIYLQADSVVVVIEGREEYHMVFALQNIPNVANLTQKILAKVIEIDSGPHSPQETDWEPFLLELKTALEGTEIGE
ncbi:hypothetical protein KAR91_60455 [Candidatus Pacearchaeota archaeon]|nr:hypothetical protein [Candidatus Pacearchaeota archaeon]